MPDKTGLPLSYDGTEVFLSECKDCLKSLPTLCLCLKNSLSDIFRHSLFNFSLIRWSSCINSCSLRFISNIFIGKSSYLICCRKNLDTLFFKVIPKEFLFKFLRRILNFFYGCFRTINGIVEYANIFKELDGFGFYFGICTIQPVYNRCIDINTHRLNLTSKIYGVKRKFAVEFAQDFLGVKRLTLWPKKQATYT
jgi:hypothetical protein